jgi:N-acetylglutamate synthase-like GNAT family acetyltransferase
MLNRAMVDMSPKPHDQSAENPCMQPVLRLATEADIEETFQVYLSANQDLNRRIGRLADLEKHTLPTRALAVRRNALRYDSERFWIAEFDRTIGGFGLAIRRRSFWYLAALHVLPQFQGRGVGGMLVRRCLGDLCEGDVKVPLLTTSDSANLASTGLYLRFGLLPQTSIIQLQGVPKPFGPSGVTLRRANPSIDEDAFGRLDQIVLGGIRPEDHQCWATVPSMTPYLAYDQDRIVGYIYIDTEGALGPAAVERPDLLSPTISAAFEALAADHSTEVQIRIPSAARGCLGFLISAGFGSITEIRLLLTSCEFGRFDRYLFSGADALL